MLARRLIYEPAMSPERDYLTQGMPIRDKYAIAALYGEPFWRSGDDEGRAAFAIDNLFGWDEESEALPACINGLVSMPRLREIFFDVRGGPPCRSAR